VWPLQQRHKLSKSSTARLRCCQKAQQVDQLRKNYLHQQQQQQQR
jgi:hypothetical protein